MKFSNLIVSLLFVFVVACSNVPVTSVPKLSRIDLRTTDLERVRAVAKVPNAIDISKIRLEYEIVISKPGAEERYRSALVKAGNDAKARNLMNLEREEGYQLVTYQIPASDIPKLEKLRELGQRWKDEGARSKGAAGIFLENLCYLPNQNNEGLKANVWVQTVETGEYVLALKNVDVSRSKYEENNERAPICN